ncbi:unnamed protein product, partial [Mesorhabditis belari]|uniref:Uncharacterized protein n=1 Tax=Mesorhabditis belari TaxID=2138241 RepID=A0AAF3FF90_9BILA
MKYELEIACEAHDLLGSPRNRLGPNSSDESTKDRSRSSTVTSATILEAPSSSSSLIELIASRSQASDDEPESAREAANETANSDTFSLVAESVEQMKVLRANLNTTGHETTRAEIRALPPMNQTQFIQMWKTFYELVSSENVDQKIFHSLAVVGTLLLQIGETYKELQAKLEADIASALSSDDAEEEKEDEEEITESDEEFRKRKEPFVEATRRRVGEHSKSVVDGEWRVTLEQVLASVLSESPLADFFDRKYSLDQIITRYRKHRFDTIGEATAAQKPIGV